MNWTKNPHPVADPIEIGDRVRLAQGDCWCWLRVKLADNVSERYLGKVKEIGGRRPPGYLVHEGDRVDFERRHVLELIKLECGASD